jgi:hypothetical protein
MRSKHLWIFREAANIAASPQKELLTQSAKQMQRDAAMHLQPLIQKFHRTIFRQATDRELI